MIQAVLFPVFNYIANNKWAQVVVGLGVGFIIYRIWLAGHDRRVEKIAVRKANDRAEKQSKTILKDMEEDINETVEAADRAAERVPDDVDSSSLPKSLSRFLRRSEPIDGGS